MKQYVCSVCGFVYQEAQGLPGAGIAPGTPWADLPEDWVCPLCGAGKGAFREQTDAPIPPAAPPLEPPHLERELTPMEMSILCSNLARGCEKQYLFEESQAFAQLADHFRQQAVPAADPSLERILALVEQDLSRGYPYANAVATDAQDRGALRALVWSEKVSRMLQSILDRYAREGERMLSQTGVYVCTICGFVSVGDAPPELCPVCKVPSWKFEQVEGRHS